MKKSCIIGLLAGLCGLANATTISGPTGGTYPLVGSSVLNGTYAYEWGNSLGSGVQLASAEIDITGTLVHSGLANGTGYLYVDLLNSSLTGVHRATDNDVLGDYWATQNQFKGANSGNLKSLGSLFFSAAGATVTWSFIMNGTSNAAALAALNSYLTANNGVFDIGLDPDCIFTISKLCFTYTTVTNHTSVPDTATTVLLLGTSLAGLELLRRKFALAK
jgi:hypothetical protein